MMKDNKSNKQLTFDAALKTPELSHFHDLIHFLEKTPFQDIFPRKYEMSLEDFTKKEVKTVFQAHPYWSLKTVMMTVLGQLPDDISDALLLKMTALSIQEWRKLSSVTAVEDTMLQAA